MDLLLHRQLLNIQKLQEKPRNEILEAGSQVKTDKVQVEEVGLAE